MLIMVILWSFYGYYYGNYGFGGPIITPKSSKPRNYGMYGMSRDSPVLRDSENKGFFMGIPWDSHNFDADFGFSRFCLVF